MNIVKGLLLGAACLAAAAAIAVKVAEAKYHIESRIWIAWLCY